MFPATAVLTIVMLAGFVESLPTGVSNEKYKKLTIESLYPEGLDSDDQGSYLPCFKYRGSGKPITVKCRLRGSYTTQNLPVCRRVVQNGVTIIADCTHQQPESLDEFGLNCKLPVAYDGAQICHCLGPRCNGNFV